MLQPRANQPKNIFGSRGKENNINVNVKIPELYNISLNDNALPDALLEFLIFEQVAGQELLSISRADMLNGQNVSYSVVSNMQNVSSEYSSSNIISVPNTLPDLFKNYGIVLENYVPELKIAADSETQQGNESPNSYIDIDDSSGTYNSLVVEFKNLQSNYSVELQVLKTGTIDDTLYDYSDTGS